MFEPVDLNEHIAQLKRDLNGLQAHAETLRVLASTVLAALCRGNKLLTCGNGGSAAEAAHFAEELTGRFYRERPSLPALCLCADSALLTCIANDYSFEDVFARQIQSLGQPGDVLVGFTSSGNSENVIRAVNAARERGLITGLFSGRDGGSAKGLADYEIIVKSKNPSSMRIQECHQLLMHVLCEMVEAGYLAGRSA
ncbi:MAG TPA: SIS domain-containing protein [Capsulimonadaceae bacterium]|nr:SIS domain-containing protein [Capsulimonadaceae bacterium]